MLNGITPDQLQQMIKVQAGPSGSTVLFVDPTLIGSDGRANPQYLQAPTTPGDLGSYVFLHGPSTLLTDLALLKDISTTFGQTSIVGAPRNVQLRLRLSSNRRRPPGFG